MDKIGKDSGELAQEGFEAATDALQCGARLQAAAAFFAFGKTPAGTGNRIALLIEEFLDLEDQDHISLAI